MKKIFAFHSPKTAGNTIACLNLAIAYQSKYPQKRVGILSCSRYADLAQYLGLNIPKENLTQLLPFIGTPEWHPALLDRLSQHQVIDNIPAPQGTQWEKFNPENWEKIFQLITDKYEVLFIDLGRDVPNFVNAHILKMADVLIATSCLDPISLAALNHFLKDHKPYKTKQHLLINQAPKEGASLINKNLKAQQGMILGILPLETKYMWDQVYKGFPLVLQKRSIFKKEVMKALENLEKS